MTSDDGRMMLEDLQGNSGDTQSLQHFPNAEETRADLF